MSFTLADFLESEFRSKKLKNARYSLRSYSRSLGLSVTTLSLYLRKRRRLSKAAHREVLDRLIKADPTFPAHEFSDYSGPSKSTSEYKTIPLDTLLTISDWYYFAILALTNCQDFEDSPTAIAKRLNLDEETVNTAIERLLKTGLLSKSRGRLKSAGNLMTTPAELAHWAQRRSHEQALELARRSLNSDPVEEKNFLSVTMAIDPELLPEAKKRMNRFADKLAAFLERRSQKRVYRLSLQLFPLSDQKSSEKQS